MVLFLNQVVAKFAVNDTEDGYEDDVDHAWNVDVVVGLLTTLSSLLQNYIEVLEGDLAANDYSHEADTDWDANPHLGLVGRLKTHFSHVLRVRVNLELMAEIFDFRSGVDVLTHEPLISD